MDNQLDIRNAVIKSVTLSTADHGCLSGWLHLDYGSEAQGFGGYMLYSPTKHLGTAGLWIWRILQTLEVSTWEDLPGKPLRVKASHSGVESIGHLLKDQWFNPREEFKALC